MLPNLKYFNDVPISDEERIMATSSIRSLHQPTDHVTGDESGYEYGPRDGSRSAVVSLERDGACVHPHTVELREKNLQRHADEFKVEGAESNELHVEMDSSASGEYSIFTAGSAPNDIIERTESHLLFSKESGLDCISFRTHTALSSRLTLVPSAPQPLIFKDRGWSLNSEFEREEERIFHEVLDSILRETFLNTFNQSKA